MDLIDEALKRTSLPLTVYTGSGEAIQVVDLDRNPPDWSPYVQVILDRRSLRGRSPVDYWPDSRIEAELSAALGLRLRWAESGAQGERYWDLDVIAGR